MVTYIPHISHHWHTREITYLLSAIMISSARKYFTDKNEDLSLLRLFKPVYLILTVVGLFPYCVKFKTKHKCVIIPRTIYLNCLCAVTLVIVMLVFASLRLQATIQDVTASTVQVTVTTHVNFTLEYSFLLISCITAYVRFYLYRYQIVNILNDMAAAWLRLPITKNRILENLRFKITCCLIAVLIMVIVRLLLNFTRKEGLWTKIVITIIFILPQTIQFLALTFYSVLVLMLIALLTNIVEALKSLPCQASAKVVMKTPITISLRSIELVCVKVFEIKRDINDAFQATILLTCMQCFHAIVSESHSIYHGTFIRSTLTAHEILNFCTWILYQLIKMYTLSYSGKLLNDAVCKIGQALHSIPTEKQDIRVLIEIQHFTSLMSYQATEFTVYGFFPLNASFLFNSFYYECYKAYIV